MRIESAKPERIIQRLIITNRIPELIAVMAEWCESENVNPNLVRLAVHIIICLRTFAVEHDKKGADDILRVYVKVMQLHKFAYCKFQTSVVP